MTGVRLKPHQQDILDAFDAGERSGAALAKRFGYSRGGIRVLLCRFGRVTKRRRLTPGFRWRPIAEADMNDFRPRVLWLPARFPKVAIGWPTEDGQWVDDCGDYVEPSHFILIPEEPE